MPRKPTWEINEHGDRVFVIRCSFCGDPAETGNGYLYLERPDCPADMIVKTATFPVCADCGRLKITKTELGCSWNAYLAASSLNVEGSE